MPPKRKAAEAAATTGARAAPVKKATAAPKPAPNTSKKRKAAEAAETTTTRAPAVKKPKATPKPASDTNKKRKAADAAEASIERAPAVKKPKATPEPIPKTTKKTGISIKKTKVLTKGKVINNAPTSRLNVYVFGEGSSGELGLGTAKNAKDVKRPRLNPFLTPEQVGVVQVEAGGMHAIALTHDSKLLTWGVNDQGALGRTTEWEGGLKDMDAAGDDSDSDDDADDNGLNPHESTPAAVDFSTTELAPDTVFTQVTAGDSCSFALTDDGKVYGWGTFRGNDGIIGFTPEVKVADRPILIAGLKDIKSIKAGANHCFALDNKGKTFSWGAGQQDQLGRRVIERTAKAEGLKPRELGLPKGKVNPVVAIESGAYHGFAITKNGDVWSWGLNNMGETGITQGMGEDDATVRPAQLVESLKGKDIVSIHGGSHHSLAATKTGDCLVWGRLDGCQMGISDDDLSKLPADETIKDERNKPRILRVPTKVTAIDGAVTRVAASSDHNIAITKDGKAWSWGFSANYQTGQGTTDDIAVATMIDNTAVREKKLNGATTGGQFSIVTAEAVMTNGA